MKMPQIDLRGKMEKIHMPKVHMPSSGEIAESYLNSGFHKSFKQPLVCKTRVEDVDVQKARQLITQKQTPAELGNLKHPLDIPLPKFKSSSKAAATTEDKEK